LRPLVERLLKLEPRATIGFSPSPDVILAADPDQLEQLLINVLRNAVDAVIEGKGSVNAATGTVEIFWTAKNGQVEITVKDSGPGIANTANLFVPFFTTKPGGSGIGLVLSRQIAEAHGGSLTIENRKDRSGCVAQLRLRTA
jgi:two-component system, NtrC family, nitrogen regulation sensor histidine kinase NtrY